MELEVYIAPLGNQEGLAIYKCPACDRLEVGAQGRRPVAKNFGEGLCHDTSKCKAHT